MQPSTYLLLLTLVAIPRSTHASWNNGNRKRGNGWSNDWNNGWHQGSRSSKYARNEYPSSSRNQLDRQLDNYFERESESLNVMSSELSTPKLRITKVSYGRQKWRVGQEDVSYTHATSETGYGTATQVGVRVAGPGARVKVKFDFTIKAVTCDDIQKTMKDEYNSWSHEEQKQVNKDWMEGKAGLDGLFKFLPFSVAVSGGKSHEDSSTKQTYETSSKVKDLIRKIHDTTKQKLRVSGTLEVVGKSYLPVEAFAYVRVMHIEYNNGEKTTVIDSPDCDNAAKAADKHGDASKVDTDKDESNLNITTLD